MISKSRFVSRYVKKRLFGSCALPLQMETPSYSASSGGYHLTHRDSCFSLADELIGRGLFSAAQEVIQRLFLQCSSVPEAILAINFALLRGSEPDLVSCRNLCKKLEVSSDTLMAEALYMRCVMGRGPEPDCRLLNSMIFCYNALGKLDEALSCFQRLLKLELTPSTGASNALITRLLEKGRILEAYDCFRGFSEASSALLHFCSYNKLLDGLCGRGFLAEGLHVFDNMVERGVAPTANGCKSLIISFCKWGRVEEAEILCTEIESYGFVADEFMYTYLINWYCKVRKMKMAMRLFFRMLKMGCQPDVYTYNTLIDGFAKLCMFPKARIVQDMMVNSGVTPNMVTYQVMLTIYCKAGQVNEAMMLLNDMLLNSITPNVHCFTVIVAALCKEQEFDKVHDLYCRMVANGVVPDHVLFFTLAKNYPKGDEFDLALCILRVIANSSCNIEISKGCLLTKFPGDAAVEIELLLDEFARNNSVVADVAFSIYIIALCQRGKLDKALDCLDEMLAHGLLPTSTAFNSLLKLLIKEGLAEKADLLLEFMQHKGLVPDQSTFLVIVDEMCNQGDYTSAIDILEQIEERGIPPSVYVYNTIICCLGKHKLVNEAEKLFYRMLSRGVDPDETLLINMLVTYSSNGQAHAAQRLFEQIRVYDLRPDIYAYTALIPVFIKKNMTAKSCLYLDRMLKDGLMPDTVLYTALMGQFLRKRDFQFAFRMFDLMERGRVEQDHITYLTLVSGLVNYLRNFGEEREVPRKRSNRAKEVLFYLLSQSTPAVVPYENNNSDFWIRTRKQAAYLILELIKRMTTIPLVRDLFVQNGIITGFCWTQNMQEAYEHVNLMLVEGVLPNCVTFSTLIGGHLRAGEIDDAIALFNAMNASGIAPDIRLLNALVIGFCKAGRTMDALCVVHMMQKKGYSPSRSCYEVLLWSVCSCSWTHDDALRNSRLNTVDYLVTRRLIESGRGV